METKENENHSSFREETVAVQRRQGWAPAPPLGRGGNPCPPRFPGRLRDRDVASGDPPAPRNRKRQAKHALRARVRSLEGYGRTFARHRIAPRLARIRETRRGFRRARVLPDLRTELHERALHARAGRDPPPLRKPQGERPAPPGG